MSTTSAGPSTDQSSYSGGAVGVTAEEFLFGFDVTLWGWIHLILGAVVALAGFALFQGASWARTVAVILVSMGIVANFLWMPYYPLWSITLIVSNVCVLWAVTVHGRDILTQ